LVGEGPEDVSGILGGIEACSGTQVRKRERGSESALEANREKGGEKRRVLYAKINRGKEGISTSFLATGEEKAELFQLKKEDRRKLHIKPSGKGVGTKARTESSIERREKSVGR